MKNWWQSLNQREQWFVGGGSTIILLVFFYVFIWSSFTASLANTKNIVLYQQNLLAWMQQAEQKIMRLRSSGNKVQTINSSNFLSTLDSTLKQQNLTSYAGTIRQTSSNKAEIKFTHVPFDEFIKWANALWSKYNIKITQIAIKPDLHTQGLVNIQVNFIF